MPKRLAVAALLATALVAFPATGVAAPPQFAREESGAARNGQSIVQAAGPRKQVVAVIPDRTSGQDWGLRYLRDAVEDLNREEPDAVFCVGDLVQGYSRSREHVLGQRNDFLEVVGRLRMPFYPTPGNHDLVSGARDPRDRRFADEYQRLFGPLYYSVELELASFVILNTEDGEGRIEPGFSDAQLSWLDERLAKLAARGRPIVLLLHRPLWDHRPTKWDERVQPMLVKHGVDYVIAGHYHALQMLPPKDGIPFLVLGTCGGSVDQHPLAGQLQHTTFVVIDDAGDIRPYHQAAGSTLPADWLLKADQDISYKMKGARDAVIMRGALPDPIGVAVEGTIEVTLKNPLDREVRFALRAAAPAAPWTVTDRRDGADLELGWTSRTAIDTFNPHTTDLRSPFALELPAEEIVVAPGASATVRISGRCDAQARPPQPPPFEVLARFLDSRGRTVPVVLRQRVPIARSVLVASTIDAAIGYPIAVWNPSPYDTAEANATVRFARGDASSKALELRLDIPDRTLSIEQTPGSGKRSVDDPLGDAVRLVLGSGPERREYLVSLSGDPAAPTPTVRRTHPATGGGDDAVAATLIRPGDEGFWTLNLACSKAALPESADLEGLALNLGVADNDETYHTQWRWLAPGEIPALLRLGRP